MAVRLGPWKAHFMTQAGYGQPKPDDARSAAVVQPRERPVGKVRRGQGSCRRDRRRSASWSPSIRRSADRSAVAVGAAASYDGAGRRELRDSPSLRRNRGSRRLTEPHAQAASRPAENRRRRSRMSRERSRCVRCAGGSADLSSTSSLGVKIAGHARRDRIAGHVPAARQGVGVPCSSRRSRSTSRICGRRTYRSRNCSSERDERRVGQAARPQPRPSGSCARMASQWAASGDSACARSSSRSFRRAPRRRQSSTLAAGGCAASQARKLADQLGPIQQAAAELDHAHVGRSSRPLARQHRQRVGRRAARKFRSQLARQRNDGRLELHLVEHAPGQKLAAAEITTVCGGCCSRAISCVAIAAILLQLRLGQRLGHQRARRPR